MSFCTMTLVAGLQLKVFFALGPLAVHDMDLDRVKLDIVFISSDGEFAWLIRMCSDCFLC